MCLAADLKLVVFVFFTDEMPDSKNVQLIQFDTLQFVFPRCNCHAGTREFSTRVYALRVNRKRQFQVRRLAFEVYENMKELFHLTTILELRTTTFDFRMATKIPIFTRSLKLHLTVRKRIG